MWFGLLLCFFKQGEILTIFSTSGLRLRLRLGVAKSLVVGFFFRWLILFGILGWFVLLAKGGRNFEGVVLIFDRMKGKVFWVCYALDFYV